MSQDGSSCDGRRAKLQTSSEAPASTSPALMATMYTGATVSSPVPARPMRLTRPAVAHVSLNPAVISTKPSPLGAAAAAPRMALPGKQVDRPTPASSVTSTPPSPSAPRARSAPPAPPPLTTDDGTYHPPPQLPPSALPPKHDATDGDVSDDDDEKARTALKPLSVAQLQDRLLQAERRVSAYRAAASDLVAALALTPDMTEAFYARSLREMLASALRTLDSIEVLSHVECSFPSVATEMPDVDLVRWDGLPYSEWNVSWAPHSWWVSVSAIGSRWGFGFNCLTTVTSIRLRGCLKCAFSEDMTSLRVAFRETPELEMHVESAVGWGAVPIPVREQIEDMVKGEIECFVRDRLTEDSVVIVLRRKLDGMTEMDLVEAQRQAERANSINLRAKTLM